MFILYPVFSILAFNNLPFELVSLRYIVMTLGQADNFKDEVHGKNKTRSTVKPPIKTTSSPLYWDHLCNWTIFHAHKRLQRDQMSLYIKTTSLLRPLEFSLINRELVLYKSRATLQNILFEFEQNKMKQSHDSLDHLLKYMFSPRLHFQSISPEIRNCVSFFGTPVNSSSAGPTVNVATWLTHTPLAMITKDERELNELWMRLLMYVPEPPDELASGVLEQTRWPHIAIYEHWTLGDRPRLSILRSSTAC